MKKFLWIVLGVGVLVAIFSGNDDKPAATGGDAQSSKTSQHALPSDWDSTTEKAGKKLNVIGSGIGIRSGPDASFDKIINQKASSIMKSTQYISIDDTTTVFEECTKGGWSWIRVVEPDWLQDSHKGWVESKYLDKGQDIGGDKYTRKISSSALLPYTKQGYSKTVLKYGSRLKEIEALRRKAAEMAVDSGKCDFVLMSELSDSKSDLQNLNFWVDCKNGERVYLDEFQIKNNSPVLTQQEKSWTQVSAMSACREAIKARALIPNEVDIHSFLGTSFYKAPTTHNVVLRMDFDAANAFGKEIPYTATCHFVPGEVGEVEIQPRQ